MSSNILGPFASFVGLPPLFTESLGSAPPSPGHVPSGGVQQCHICGREQGPIDFIFHMMYEHPEFFVIWADYSYGNWNPAEAVNAATERELMFAHYYDDDTAAEDEYDEYDEYDEDAAIAAAEADAEADAGAEDETGYDTESSEEPPTPSYEQLTLLCEEMGDHPVGVNDIDAVAPIVLAPTDPTMRCTICLETMDILPRIRKITRCRHEFCDPCIRRWFREHHTCPICKDDVPRSV